MFNQKSPARSASEFPTFN